MSWHFPIGQVPFGPWEAHVLMSYGPFIMGLCISTIRGRVLDPRLDIRHHVPQSSMRFDEETSCSYVCEYYIPLFALHPVVPALQECEMYSGISQWEGWGIHTVDFESGQIKEIDLFCVVHLSKPKSGRTVVVCALSKKMVRRRCWKVYQAAWRIVDYWVETQIGPPCETGRRGHVKVGVVYGVRRLLQSSDAMLGSKFLFPRLSHLTVDDISRRGSEAGTTKAFVGDSAAEDTVGVAAGLVAESSRSLAQKLCQTGKNGNAVNGGRFQKQPFSLGWMSLARGGGAIGEAGGEVTHISIEYLVILIMICESFVAAMDGVEFVEDCLSLQAGSDDPVEGKSLAGHDHKDLLKDWVCEGAKAILCVLVASAHPVLIVEYHFRLATVSPKVVTSGKIWRAGGGCVPSWYPLGAHRMGCVVFVAGAKYLDVDAHIIVIYMRSETYSNERTSIEDTISKFESLRRAAYSPGILLFMRERALAYEFDERGHPRRILLFYHRRYLPISEIGFVPARMVMNLSKPWISDLVLSRLYFPVFLGHLGFVDYPLYASQEALEGVSRIWTSNFPVYLGKVDSMSLSGLCFFKVVEGHAHPPATIALCGPKLGREEPVLLASFFLPLLGEYPCRDFQLVFCDLSFGTHIQSCVLVPMQRYRGLSLQRVRTHRRLPVYDSGPPIDTLASWVKSGDVSRPSVLLHFGCVLFSENAALVQHVTAVHSLAWMGCRVFAEILGLSNNAIGYGEGRKYFGSNVRKVCLQMFLDQCKCGGVVTRLHLSRWQQLDALIGLRAPSAYDSHSYPFPRVALMGCNIGVALGSFALLLDAEYLLWGHCQWGVLVVPRPAPLIRVYPFSASSLFRGRRSEDDGLYSSACAMRHWIFVSLGYGHGIGVGSLAIALRRLMIQFLGSLGLTEISALYRQRTSVSQRGGSWPNAATGLVFPALGPAPREVPEKRTTSISTTKPPKREIGAGKDLNRRTSAVITVGVLGNDSVLRRLPESTSVADVHYAKEALWIKVRRSYEE
ncbi:hypothetical protein Tco_1018982 [Tanacetum coccineum]|uniref:Uncharacterized protein n=1 Tax=Tanacetum coccineum TaxID=301880 RepID=A0ABQ5FVW6_9ASTR